MPWGSAIKPQMSGESELGNDWEPEKKLTMLPPSSLD
jgi:hypothetical protein